MVQGSFVLTAHLPKTAHEKRMIDYRSTNLRYLVVLLAILVVFVYEYCFDNPSVGVSRGRPSRRTSSTTTSIRLASR
jgi:hypothetical protein